MSEKHTFKAIFGGAGSGGAYVRVPFDVEKAFGQKRVKVRTTIDRVLYRGSLVRMGAPYHILIVLKAIREKIGKSFGDEVEITIQEDTQPRVVKVPKDFAAALKGSPQAKQFFDQLSYTHQREYVLWIEEAKREATRENRIKKAIGMLLEGTKAR